MPNEFEIRWEINEISKLDSKGIMSPRHYHCGMPWQIRVCTEQSERTDNVNHLSIYIFCNAESDCDLWHVEQRTTLMLVHRDDREKNKQRTIKKPINKAEDYHWGYPDFFEFANLLRPSQGFIKDRKVIVEARIDVISVIGARIAEIDFSQPSLNADNITLKIGDDSVKVCRKYLTWHSPFFASLLIDGKDNDSEVILENVQIEEFTELLHVIYPLGKQINVDTYKPILILAERFQIESALDLVEKYLIKTDKMKPAAKLLLSVQHRLELLQGHCFLSLNTIQKIKQLENEKEFYQITASLKMRLLKKVYELIKIPMAIEPTFSFRWEIDAVANLPAAGHYSPVTYAKEVPWRFFAKAHTYENGDRWLSVLADCNWESECPRWRIDHVIDIRILNGGNVKYSKMFCDYFSAERNDWGISKYLSFDDLLNSDKNYLVNGKLILEAQVHIKKMWGIKKRVVIDFCTPSVPLRSSTLQIDGKYVYVSKEFLATHSPVFSTTFFGEFEEKKKDIIKLNDIVYEEFIDFLNILYPTTFEISKSTVMHILILADRFQVDIVLHRVQEYFMKTKKFSILSKMKIAEDYRLHELLDYLVRSFTDVEQIKAIKNTLNFVKFSAELKSALCDRILEF